MYAFSRDFEVLGYLGFFFSDLRDFRDFTPSRIAVVDFLYVRYLAGSSRQSRRDCTTETVISAATSASSCGRLEIMSSIIRILRRY